ncbi:MAG TPA: hypothetical protein VKE74_29980 [Gemmataceae bacterium]|nr:hypothetical protein [Gemmataceae bacterium]
MTTRVSCPYCNTSFVPPAVPPSRRIDCPRCGEAFALKGDAEAGATDDIANLAPVSLGTQYSVFRTPNRTRWSALWPVAVALGMGLVGLGIGLGLYYFRSHKPGPEPDLGPLATPTPPAEVAGLAYLPPDCNLVFAAQPGPLLVYAARTNQDPKELLTRAGLPAEVFAFLDKAGIPLPQIDHIVGGAMIPDPDQDPSWRFALVLALHRPPADEDQFLRALEAKKDPHGKPRYSVTLNVGATLPLLLTRVSPTVWVFGWSDMDLGPAERAGASLSHEMREMIRVRLLPEAAIWAAADNGRWAEKPLVRALALQAGGKNWLPALARVQAGVVGLSFGEQPRAHLFVRCVDNTAGEKLRAYFQTKATDGVQTGGAGEWVLFNPPFDPQTGVQTLKQFLDDAAK